jgi:hypothetical protein
MLTDNQGLLTRLSLSLPYPEPFPNLTLAPNWDVTNEIALGLRTFTTTPTLQHVKGHQDNHAAYSDLSLEAQLNVDADAEAGYFQCMYPAQRPLIPRLPSNHIQLHLDGKVVCSHLKRTIRDAATVPGYLGYISTCFHWPSSVAATIDWQAYTQTIQRLCTPRPHKSPNYVTIYFRQLDGPIDTTN